MIIRLHLLHISPQIEGLSIHISYRYITAESLIISNGKPMKRNKNY